MPDVHTHVHSEGCQIWKYMLNLEDAQTLSIPRGAQFLSVDNQRGQLCLWALVAEAAELEERTIAVIGTGNPIPPGRSYRFLGTAVIETFAWHVFEFNDDP